MHDGFGADAMALLLRLRRTAEETGSEEHAVLRDRAQQVLDEVRTVVWSLRSNQGTVGELGKLVGVMCRRESQDAAYIAPGPDVASCTVDPVSALQAVRKAREVLRCLARHHGKNLEIELGSPRDFSSAQGEPPNGEGALEGLDPVPMELRLHGGIPLATQPCKAELTALLAHDARVTWDATETGMNVTVLLPLCAKSTRRSRWSLSEAELEDALALRERE
jgi:hypothetical protein